MAKKQPESKPESPELESDELEDLLEDPIQDFDDEELTEDPPAPPAVTLPFTAQELAAQARAAKIKIHAKDEPAHKSIMTPVIEAHKAYIKAVLKGADAPPTDLDFVKASLKHLRANYGV